MAQHAPSHRRDVESLVVQLPCEVVPLLGSTPSDAAAYLERLALIDLFRRGEVTSGYAAEVLGIGKWEFIELLGQHKVSYFDVTEDELRQEIEILRSIRPAAGGASSPAVDH